MNDKRHGFIFNWICGISYYFNLPYFKYIFIIDKTKDKF